MTKNMFQKKIMKQTLAMSLFFILLSITVCSLSEANQKLKHPAEALVKAADECLFDVRDRGKTYQSSSNCNALKTLSMNYIEAGGFQENTPDKYKLLGSRARMTAWMALATSLAGGQRISIW